MEQWCDALDGERVAAALTRVNDLWPEGLEAVPGSHEVAVKRDADTLRAALKAARLNAQVFPHGISWQADPAQPGTWMLELHRDGWDIEAVVGGVEASFSAMPVEGANSHE